MSVPPELAAVPLFRGLSETQLATISAVLRRARARAGDAILSEGDVGRSLFVLARGTVETTKRMGVIGADGELPRQKVLVRMTAPQSFGEIGLLEESPRSATVRAATDCDLLELRREDFEKLVAGDTHLGYLLVRNVTSSLIQRLRRTDRDIIKLTAALSIALGNR
jgi:CRP/FNR family transcriptional regulator, cyclic AMP receptor protein